MPVLLEPILSAAEVNALLEAAESRNRRGLSLEAQPVDLLAGDRYLRLLIPALSVGYARLAEGLRKILTSVLRLKVEIREEPPQVLTGRGVAKLAARAACLVDLDVTTSGGTRGHGLLALDRGLTFRVIDRLFGGSGDGPSESFDRSPTALERHMLLHALRPVIRELNDTLEPKGFFEFAAQRIESRLDLIPGMNPDIVVLHAPFSIAIGEAAASLSLILPAHLLEPLRSTVYDLGSATQSSTALRETMLRTPVTVCVELGGVDVSVRELAGLRPGVVLKLERHRMEEVPIRIEGIDKFFGRPVNDNGVVAVEVTRRTT